jgi:deoxyribonuclease-4
MSEFDSVVGLPRLAAVHVNDSRKPFGSRLDRHEHIGKGMIGAEGFRALMNDARLERVPKILETEKSEDMHEDLENMSTLRSLIL